MNTTWPASKLAWIITSISGIWRTVSKDSQRMWANYVEPARTPTSTPMPKVTAKGTMQEIHAQITNPVKFAFVETPNASDVDVSHVSRMVHFWSPVVLDSETFGVLVTRRSCATGTNLVPQECARLLDLLVAAKEFMGQCEEEPRQFELWVISSDSRDAKPRNVWLELKKQAGAYRISLTDM
jgi:hypothetical protein